jgi:hypothetical protein
VFPQGTLLRPWLLQPRNPNIAANATAAEAANERRSIVERWIMARTSD